MAWGPFARGGVPRSRGDTDAGGVIRRRAAADADWSELAALVKALEPNQPAEPQPAARG